MADVDVCKRCGSQLKHEEWNSSTVITVCDNYQCTCFRAPVSTRERVAKEPKFRIPECLGDSHDPKGSKFSARLQRLRDKLYAEDEETEVP